MKHALILFTRVPQSGATKTRMMPHLSADQCEKLHTCFLMDIEKECRKCRADLFVCYTPSRQEEKIRRILGGGKQYFAQTEQDLGLRMYNAIERVLAQGYEKCVLIGTDVPELDCRAIEGAFAKLEKKEIVFGRTTDGGYYLVGMKRPIKEAFGLGVYGHGSVLSDTVRNLCALGLDVGYTASLQDMDTPEDLRQYCRRMSQNPRLQRTRTGRFLAKNRKISIIVPVYNESGTILQIQEQLRPLLGKCEILFVDGGSTDGTAEKIAPEFKVLLSEKGRAKQMNLGARESAGDILFFLHCDSELPTYPLERIRKVMKDHRAGCFGIAFHSFHFFMFTCRVISNHRIKDRKVMFGDQGIFADRDLFFEAGMYPEIPIMEDYQFSLTLKEMGVKLGMADRRIYTSDRRFPRGTIPKLRVMWKMNRLRKMYRDGVGIEEIAAHYRDVR